MICMFLPVVGAITITCSSIKSKNFRIRMWIIKYISIVVLNGIVIAKIRITWFDGTEVTMTDVCVWIYIFWNMSHCKGVPSSTAVCHIWIYVTRFNVTHHKVLLNQLFQKLNFPTLYGAVQCGQPRWSNLRWKRWFMRYRNRVGTGTQDLFQISSITHPEIKIMIPNFWTEIFSTTSRNWPTLAESARHRWKKTNEIRQVFYPNVLFRIS